MSLCQYVTVSICHCVNVSVCQYVYLRLYIFVYIFMQVCELCMLLLYCHWPDAGGLGSGSLSAATHVVLTLLENKYEL